MNRAIQSYQKTMVQTSSPVENIVLLYERCLHHLGLLRQSIEKNDLESKQLYLGKAIDIINALDGGLDFNIPDIAQSLHDVYQSALMQLTRANTTNDAGPVAAVEEWLGKLLETWKQIRDDAKKSGQA